MADTDTQLELNVGNNEEYKVEAIRDSVVFARESEAGQSPGLYFWSPGKATQRKKKPGNPHLQSSTSESWSAPFTKTTKIRRQRFLCPSTSLRQWQARQTSRASLPRSESVATPAKTLESEERAKVEVFISFFDGF